MDAELFEFFMVVFVAFLPDFPGISLRGRQQTDHFKVIRNHVSFKTMCHLLVNRHRKILEKVIEGDHFMITSKSIGAALKRRRLLCLCGFVRADYVIPVRRLVLLPTLDKGMAWFFMFASCLPAFSFPLSSFQVLPHAITILAEELSGGLLG